MILLHKAPPYLYLDVTPSKAGCHVELRGDDRTPWERVRPVPTGVNVRLASGAKVPRASFGPWRRTRPNVLATEISLDEPRTGGWARIFARISVPGFQVASGGPVFRFFGSEDGAPVDALRRALLGHRVWSRGGLYPAPVASPDDGKDRHIEGRRVTAVRREGVRGRRTIWGGNPRGSGTEALPESVFVDRPILVEIDGTPYRFVSPQHARKLLSLVPPKVPARFAAAYRAGRVAPGMTRELASFIVGLPLDLRLRGPVLPVDPWQAREWTWSGYAPFSYTVTFKNGRVSGDRIDGDLP